MITCLVSLQFWGDVILGVTSFLSSPEFGFFRLRVLIQGVLKIVVLRRMLPT